MFEVNTNRHIVSSLLDILANNMTWHHPTIFLLFFVQGFLSTCVARPSNSSAEKPSQPFLVNDFLCRSSRHPNPVVVIHGAVSNLNDKDGAGSVEKYLHQQGFCVFALTYGAYPQFPSIGGLRAINESSQEIASFIRTVRQRTNAKKIDLVGHSEGAFQVMYVPKFTGVSDLLDNLVAIAPPTRGCTAQVFSLLPSPLRQSIIKALGDIGVAGMADILVDGTAVRKLNDGNAIVQSGNNLTIIASRNDVFITPTNKSFVHEDGVKNYYVQDYCPFDPVGHLGECKDITVLSLMANALAGQPQKGIPCTIGFPVRRNG